MISRQNIIAVFMALLLTIFLIGCVRQVENKETPAPSLPDSAPTTEPVPADIPAVPSVDETAAIGDEPLPGEPPSEQEVILDEPANSSY
ncbi:MAG: OadG family protein [Candidatus Woesearchaeota archaeon]|nr:OadG family protein [Candidatus Woesearchaeota archaeon]